VTEGQPLDSDALDDFDDDTNEFTPDQLRAALPPPRADPPLQPINQPGPMPPTGYGTSQAYGPPPGHGPPPGYYQQPSYPPPGYPAGYGPPGYPAYSSHPPYVRNQGMGTASKAFLLLLLLAALLLLGLVVGLLAGFIRVNDLTSLLGMGPGRFIVHNMSDDRITVDMRRIDAQGETLRFFDDGIAPADVRSYPDRQTGTWQLVFRKSSGGGLGSCNLGVAGNGEYTFIVLRQLVVVSQTGVEPQTGDEMIVQTSPLCRAQP
jgi:hypothetical protein